MLSVNCRELSDTYLARSLQWHRGLVLSHTWGSSPRHHLWWTAPPGHPGETGTAWSGDACRCSHMQSNCHIRSPPVNKGYTSQVSFLLKSKPCVGVWQQVELTELSPEPDRSPARWWLDLRSDRDKASSWVITSPSIYPQRRCILKYTETNVLATLQHELLLPSITLLVFAAHLGLKIAARCLSFGEARQADHPGWQSYTNKDGIINRKVNYVA